MPLRTFREWCLRKQMLPIAGGEECSHESDETQEKGLGREPAPEGGYAEGRREKGQSSIMKRPGDAGQKRPPG